MSMAFLWYPARSDNNNLACISFTIRVKVGLTFPIQLARHAPSHQPDNRYEWNLSLLGQTRRNSLRYMNSGWAVTSVLIQH
jgi:hypothetical protein